MTMRWMSHPGLASRPRLAAVLAALLVFGTGFPVPAFADNTGQVQGHITQADGKDFVNAKVHAVNVTTGQKFSSELTRGGSYEVKGLPPGTYDVAIEVDGKIFVADDLVDVGPNDTVSVDYDIDPDKPGNRRVKGLPAPAGSAQTPESIAPPPALFWKSKGGIALLTLLGAGAAYVILDDDASPSNP